MPVLLPEIVRHKVEEIAARKLVTPFYVLKEAVKPAQNTPFLEALAAASVDSPQFILEVKPASPSAGVLTAKLDLTGLLPIYNRYAAGLSVLTDAQYFKGSLALLTEVTQRSPHPTLCKDFVIDSYQIWEACQCGASAVLLIVKILTDTQLKELMDCAKTLNLTAVVEIQTKEELQRALAVHPEVVLINNRNLDTFEIDLATTSILSPKVPEGIVVISASGIHNRSDIDKLLPSTQCFLIGSALMATPIEQLDKKLREITGR